MADKIYNKLPAILQTDTIKNFFEGTVEQLYSKANVESISGFVGKKTSQDKLVDGTWIYEDDIDKQYYNLLPTINNTNANTGVSENFIFYDEFVDTLKNYNVDTLEQNQWLKTNFTTFLPPVELNKFLNYQEYYWSTTGPTAIIIIGSINDQINVDKDIVGQTSYTPSGGKAFKNGMKVTFSGDYVIDTDAYVGKEFIVEGVGESIILVPVDVNYANGYNNPQTSKDYVLLGRGAENKNVWSRVNFWYHKENFTDAGDDIPAKITQADRPILEFDRDLELFNVGSTSKGNVDVSSTLLFSEVVGLDASNVAIDTVTIETGTKIIFPNDSKEISANVYVASVDSGNANAISLSVSSILSSGDTVFVSSGSAEIGKEFYYNDGLVQAQTKSTLNQAPLFKLYDDKLRYLGDNTIYPSNNFNGNKIFGFEVGTGVVDKIYNLPLAFRSFKNASEISFENFMETETYNNIVIGSTTPTEIPGYYYYKILRSVYKTSDDGTGTSSLSAKIGKTAQYHNNFKNPQWKSQQRIERVIEITRTMFDNFEQIFELGCSPRTGADFPSGMNIRVKKNGEAFHNFTYINDGFKIEIDRNNFVVGDIFEISVFSRGLSNVIGNKSKHELPLAWGNNPFKEEVTKISEPEFLPHFKNYMEKQPGFTGDALSVNNFSSLTREELYATDIVQPNQDLVLGAFLLDDQPHNIVDALRFNGAEYNKYKKRFFKELNDYYNVVDFKDFSNEEILEKVLRNLISFSVGRNVFGQTYILPFGDNYSKESIIVNDITLASHTISTSLDLDKVENSLLVYYIRDNIKTLLTVGEDYTLTFSPLTVTFKNYNPELLDEIEFKIYNEDRDSVECPPTPSTMGLYPLYYPEKITDNTFQDSQELIVGHDGSRTPIYNDERDDIVLEFEKRIYNSAKAEFRDKNEYPELNVLDIRQGRWRRESPAWDLYNDLLQTSFENWVVENKVDPVKNEFFDNNNPWTWNYTENFEGTAFLETGTGTIPGHWRGWYEYYFDTVRPHTHPWEMLGFIQKPEWWDNQYITTTYSDYGSNNRPMWEDLEKGIIRQGPRENVTNELYRDILNRFSRRSRATRINLIELIPVDANANLKTPKEITSTGVSTFRIVWTTTEPDVTQGFKTTSFLAEDGINVQFDAVHRYIESYNIPNYSRRLIDQTDGAPEQGIFPSTYRIPNNMNYNSLSFGNESTTNNELVQGSSAILINGLPLASPLSDTYTDNTWIYDLGYQTAPSRANGDISKTTEDGTIFTAIPTEDMSNSSVWGNSTTHSGVIGWAFDGLPIYGPYGYANAMNSGSSITNIKSAFKLKAGNRGTGPKGAHTGEFVQDYEYDATKTGIDGYADRYNTRYGFTPDSPSTAIRYYVATIDDTGTPMFPYAVGGGTTTFDSDPLTYAGVYAGTGFDIDTNKNGTALTSTTATYAKKSESATNITLKEGANLDTQWKFGDGAPVENAWKYSVKYPFAIAELLCLASPGKFATVFSDPTKITKAPANYKKYINNTTRKNWNFLDSTHFNIHGDIDSNGNSITNIGYTQFVNSWLRFQGLDVVTNFVEKLRNLNVKLGYRFSGYIDKDTMTMSMDQFSTTGSSTNLIIPQENITVDIHNSPYKTRNIYQGVIIQKTTAGYCVKGYDKNLGHFKILESDVTGRSSKVQVGGEAHPFVDWQANKSYNKGTIVRYEDVYYEAKEYVPKATTFSSLLYKKLNKLPQINFKEGAVFLDTTNLIKKVEYGTVYANEQDVFDFLISLGRYQKQLGYTFGEYDGSINDTRDWLYSAKQFLFWLQGNWQTDNTLELSPMASKVTFETTKGFVAKIKRNEFNMFNIMDKDGKSINPKECAINRRNLRVEIIPPIGKEIYSVCLFTREIEHAMVLDNVTDFADTLYIPLYNQKQSRIKIKGNKTANWDGRFISEGFLIEGDALKPNLDNLAESMGRYHELGFIPVEKQVYETARNLFGYQEKDYLAELQIDDDQQFEFYKGFIQNKGTKTSLSRIGRSSAIIQGDMDIYDEWAIKVGSFGDLENNQSVELALDKTDFVQDPQLFTLSFPEDTTGVVDRIDILNTKHKYFDVPEVLITEPTTGTTAKATAVLDNNGLIGSINITEQGTGYTDTPGLTIITGEISVGNVSNRLARINARSSNTITSVTQNTSGNVLSTSNANINALGTITIADEFGATASFNLNSITDVANITTAINSDATINANITAHTIENYISNSGNVIINKGLKISGNDFTIGGHAPTLANLNITAGRYQPRQRYAVNIANNTVKSNIIVSVDSTTIASSNYVFDAGDRWQITAPSTVIGNSSVSFAVNTGAVNSSTALDSNNILEYDGVYPFVDVYLNGTKIENPGYETRYRVDNTTTITFPDVGLLPDTQILSGSNVYIVERATIDLEDAYQGDLPGSTLSVKATTNDDIAVHVKSVRIFEITPDAKDDEVILIDIDDTTRFLKKPSGVRESNLWPKTGNVSFRGITDTKYNPLPNAGYVNESNVNFSAFDLGGVAELFADNIRFKPTGNDFIHVAKSENLDWNVYKLKQANKGNITFVEQDDVTETAHLYTERSLFNYVDSNQLLENDLSRFLDYALVIKKADLSDEFVIWQNEDIVRRKSVQISNFGRAEMITANIGNIGPTRVVSISNITPAISSYTNADANIIGSNTVQITGSQSSLQNGEQVEFFVTSITDRAFTTSNVEYVTKSNTSNLNNTSESNRTLSFTVNDSYDFANVIYAGNSATIPLESLEMAVYNANANSTVSFFNESNIILPATHLPATNTSITLTRLHTGKLKLGVANINLHGAGIVAANNVVRLTATNNLYNNNSFTVSEVDTANNTVTIDIDLTNQNIDLTDDFDQEYVTVADLGISGFVFEEQHPLHAQRHVISNVGITGFTVTQSNVSANIDAGNLSYGIFGKTQITATDHDLSSGELVKLDANAYSGFYYVESASKDTFKIDAPFNANVASTGNIIPEGITINTTEDHGINVSYTGKRIAVHLATPRYYNQVYRVSDVTANTVLVDNAFGFYPYASEQFRDWSAGLTVSKDERIRNAGVYYNATQDFTTNVSISVDIEAGRFKAGMPTTITTLDHGAITLNNSLININNVNSPESIKEEFNRQIDLRRGLVDDDGLTIPMINNIECSEKVYAGIPATQIAGSGPYVPRSPNMEGLTLKGYMPFATEDDLKYGFPGEVLDDVSGDGIVGDHRARVGDYPGFGLRNPKIPGRSLGSVIPNTQIPLYDIQNSGKTRQRTDYIGSPIIDPTKAFAALDVKLCDICAPSPPPVSSTVTNRNGKKYINKNYGGTISVSASGNGKGARRWQNTYSGYYVTTGPKRGEVTQFGGSKHMPADGLLGAMTWADNGSTNTFSLNCTFSEAGTFYVHAYYSARNTASTSKIFVDGTQIIPKYLGKADQNYSGSGQILEITVTAGQTVTISGRAKYGSNHWNSVGFHLSTRSNSLSTTATIEDPTTTTPPVTGNTSTSSSLIQEEFVEQSTRGWGKGNAGTNDEWLFNPGASGTVEVLFDMYSGADGIEIYQGDQVTQGSLIGSSQVNNLSVLTEAEKSDILSNAQKAKARGGRNPVPAGVIRNFEVSARSAPNNTGVKYGGAVRINYDKAQGDYIKIVVYKSSSVYRFLLRYPKIGPDIPNPGVNPVTTGPCDTASDGNSTVSGSSLPQTPINTPVGGGSTTGGGTTGGTTGGGTTGGGTTGGVGSGGGKSGGGSVARIQAQTLKTYGPVYVAPPTAPFPIPSPIPQLPFPSIPFSPLPVKVPFTPFIVPNTIQKLNTTQMIDSLISGSVKGIKNLIPGGNNPKAFFTANFGDVGLPSLAGYRFIPNVLRKTVKTVKANDIGRFIPLEGSQYVNTTMQKVTGGKKVPLATPLANKVPLKPSPLRAIDVKDYNYNFVTKLNNPYFSKTDASISFAAQKIGGDLILPDGSSIRNVLGDASGIDANNIQIRYPGSEIIDFVNRGPNQPTYDYLPADSIIPTEISPPDSDNIEFNRAGGFSIQPLLRTPEGNYLPGGPEIGCHLTQPTPGISIPFDKLEGIKPGEELLINNRKYTFPGSDPKVVINTLKCGPTGSGIEVKNTKVNGVDAIRISSCSNAPIIIRDGCAGGIYKEVLDFHVVRGFEQSVVDVSNTVVLPGFSQSNSSIGATTVDYTTYGPTGTITGTLNSFAGDGVGSVLSSSSSSRSTGGSGYVVGDRLRLVGGTPVADPYGSVTEICIDSPGTGYSDTANVVVYIGDGNTPGSGAKTGSVILDDSGAIQNILMVNGGEGYDITNPPKIRIIDLNDTGKVLPATAHAKISSGASVPPRVAKFVVTTIDAIGTITSLQIIDRGIYKVFPSDLTMGIPLEYDYVNLGDETGTDADGNFYQGTGLGQIDPLGDGTRLGSPGGYDPINDTLAGGSGARVFLTSREIPDCSEKGNARSTLGLPERVTEINIPEDIVACFNNNLGDTGLDDDIYLDTEPVNDCITAIKIRTPGFDGVRLDENIPGFLDRIGLPKGDYNQDMLCMTSTIITKSFEQDRDNRENTTTGFDIIDVEGYGTSGFATTEATTLEINCIDRLETDPNSLFGVAGNTGGTGAANAVGLSFTTDLYQYELRNLSGAPVNTLSLQQNCDVYYLESHRFANTSVIDSHTHIDDGNVTLTSYDKVWVDTLGYHDATNSSVGWAYLESNVIQKQKESLVDSKFVNNTIIYDSETGEKDWDLYEYDPYKGVIPGFLEKEIEFIGESDPVVYNLERTRFGSKDVGKVWWDTSTIRYRWYEQGTNRERWLNWGKAFPGSSVTLYEWVKSNTLPQSYRGTGNPKNAVDYITETVKNTETGLNEICYYFWVQNKRELDTHVSIDLNRKHSTFELARLLADPIGQGLPLISFVSDSSFVLTNASSIIKQEDQNLQINLSRNLNPIGQKHDAWKLLREGDNNSIIPDDLGNKLIDSLCGVDASGKSVPDPLLSEVEKYGVAFRPRQTMFEDVKEARRELAFTLNEILADIKLNSEFVNWDRNLPTTRTYIENVDWFDTIRTDASNNKKIRYDSTFKPILNVGSISELTAITGSIKDGAIIQVQPNVTSRYELWKYVSSTNSFSQIAIEKETVKLKDTIFTDDTNVTMQTELRELIVALRDNVFKNTVKFNELYFALLKYSAVEQDQLSWAFKTSYVYVEKEEEDLVKVDGFKVDNFDKVLKYFDEAKPYTSKVREYKDGKSPPKEFITDNMISDFDKPPFPDSTTGNVRILDDFLQSDSNIIQTNNNYVKYFGFSGNANADTPIRKIKSTIKFDRTNTILTDFEPLENANLDYTKADTNTSIATNIVTLMDFGNTHNSNTTIASNVYYRYADRVFKYDPEVQAQFKVELDSYFNVTDSVSNANIIGSSANILAAINAGNLNSTLDLVSTKVGGKFRGTTLDANLFTKVVAGASTQQYQTQFGFGSEPFERASYDNPIEVENYVGSFTESSTLTEDNVAYEGFDGVTFQRVGYGERVPEEMALFDPYETLIVNVLTSNKLSGNSSLASASANASTVEFQITMDLFGKTEYMRKLQDGTGNTLLTANLLIVDNEISVANANIVSEPTATVNGVVWVESERIEYTRVDLANNKLSGLIRGTKGTTIQDWYSNNTVIVWDGSEAQIFKNFVANSVDSNVWLDSGATSLTDKGNVSGNTSVMNFLHNLK